MATIPVPSLSPTTWHTRKILLGEVWRLSLPVIMTNFLQSMVDVVDVFMVGRLGPLAIAAVGMSSAIRFLVMVMLLSVAAGAMTLIAQARGARDPERMSFVTRQSLSSGILLSIVLAVVGYFLARPLLTLANRSSEQEVIELGVQYLQIIFLGSPFLVLNIVQSRLMQGAGDTVTPLWLGGSLNVFNVLLNYLLIFGLGPIPAYGVAGSAMGTVLARAIGVAIAYYLIYSGRNVVKLLPGSYWPNWRMFADIFSIGLPSGIQGVFRNGSRLFVLGIITATEVGAYGAAAMAIGFQLELLVFMPGLGINLAATTLVGQSLGKWQPDEARMRGNMAIGLGLIVMILLAAPIILFAEQIIRFFDPSAHPILLKTGITYLHINTVALPLSAVALVANGALRGAGDSVPGLISTMLTRAVVAVALAWCLAFPLGMGSLGVWLALVVGIVLDALYMGIRWHSETWLDVALHKSEVYRQHLHRLPRESQQQYLREVRTPLMAQPATREQVTTEQVVYQQPTQSVTVRFGQRDYQVISTLPF